MILAGVEAERTELPLGTLDLAAPAPHVLASRLTGMGSGPVADRIVAFGDALLRQVPRIWIFHDFTDVNGYQSDARKRLVAWGVDRRNAIAVTHVLFRSKLVSMGVGLARVLLRGQLEGHADRARFDAALGKTIAYPPTPDPDRDGDSD